MDFLGIAQSFIEKLYNSEPKVLLPLEILFNRAQIHLYLTSFYYSFE